MLSLDDTPLVALAALHVLERTGTSRFTNKDRAMDIRDMEPRSKRLSHVGWFCDVTYVHAHVFVYVTQSSKARARTQNNHGLEELQL